MNSMFAVLFKFLVTMNHQIALMNYVADLEDFGGVNLLRISLLEDKKRVNNQLKILLGG